MYIYVFHASALERKVSLSLHIKLKGNMEEMLMEHH